MRCFWALFLALPLGAAVIPGRYIVELSAEPVANHVSRARTAMHSPEADLQRTAIRNQQAVARRAIEAAGGTILGAVENVRNALFVSIPDDRAAQLNAISGVQRVHPERLFEKLLDRALPLHHVPDAWAQVGIGNAGAGIKIGMIDTGITIAHPGFRDGGFTAPQGYPLWDSAADQSFTNNKVIVARSYAAFFPAADPDPSAQDDSGHGTGTAMAAAGITSVAPLATITGVAPQAYLGIYKVFGTPGVNDSAPESAILTAIDDAVNDGMDVINLSLGSPLAGPAADDTEVAAIESAAAAGVIVTVSAGNSGPNPATIGTPAIAPSAIAVGASVNDRVFAGSVNTPDGASFAAQSASNSVQSVSLSGPLVDITQFDFTSLACTALPPNSLSGAVALISRGTCLFTDKLSNAQAAGAVAAVIYDNIDSEPLFIMGASGSSIPSDLVSLHDGLALRSLAANTPSVNLQFAAPQSVDPAALAAFSAAGPTPDFTIKPDLVAVGANFYTAAESLNSAGDLYDPSGFTVSQGTSFSAPLVAGAAAILKQARPGLTAQQYRSLLIDSADRAFAMPGTAAHVQQSGGGVMNVFAALNATATASPVSLTFGYGGNSLDAIRTLTITNIGASTDTFRISPIGLDPTAPVPVPLAPSVTLAPNASADIPVQFTAAGLTPGPYEGFLRIQGANSTVATSVPYWYGVASDTPGFISVLYGASTAAVKARISQAAIFRLTDAAGLPVAGVSPVVTSISGGGTVTAVSSFPGFGLGVYSFSARMGPLAGANQFQIQAGSVTAVISITVQ